jgi:hypothetical protein
MIFVLGIILGVVWYIMTPGERERVVRPVMYILRRAWQVAVRCYHARGRFRDAVRARNPLALGALATVAVTVIAVAGYAIHRQGLIDVRPEIERLLAAEERMARTYQAAVNQFKLGTINAEALAEVIDRTIKPELQMVRTRLTSLDRVAPEDVPLVARASEYVRLRDESWRLRAKALHDHSLVALLKADKAERASLDALEKIRPAEQQ